MKALTQAQVDAYREKGYLFPMPGLSPDELAECRAGLDRFETYLGAPVAKAELKWRSHAFAHSPWFAKLAMHPKILDAVEDIIGPNILIWTSRVAPRKPDDVRAEGNDADLAARERQPVAGDLALQVARVGEGFAACMVEHHDIVVALEGLAQGHGRKGLGR